MSAISAIALAGPEDSNVIYAADANEHLAARLKYRYEDGGRRVTILDASKYGNELSDDHAPRFTSPNSALAGRVADSDITIVTNIEAASKKTLNAMIELVKNRTIDGAAVPGVEVVVFVVSSLKSPNAIALQKRAPRDFAI